VETELFTWGALATVAGASLSTYLFVQLTKSIIDRFAPWLPTDLYAACIAFMVLLLAAIKGGADATDWGVYVLSFLNGLLVWSLAGKMYSVAVDPPKVGKRKGVV
jgi:Na+-transporting NADH:ubiquinone oxidoreductase subunit NqrB